MKNELILAGRLETAREDSLAQAQHFAAEKRSWEWTEAMLRDQLPHWYERPAFVAGLTAVIVIWATLQAVKISL